MAFKYAFNSDDEHAGLVEVTGSIVRETTKAVLFSDGVSQQWLPRSKIKLGMALRNGTLPVFMPEWLAREKKYI